MCTNTIDTLWSRRFWGPSFTLPPLWLAAVCNRFVANFFAFRHLVFDRRKDGVVFGGGGVCRDGV